MNRAFIAAGCVLALALVATARARQEQAQEGAQEEIEVKPRVEFESFAFPALAKELAERDGTWNAFFENGTMQCGVYRIATGGVDGQRPHAMDELYYVVAGRSKFTAGEETVAVAPGAVYFVAAEVEHRFHDVEEDLEVLVFFSKAKIEQER